MSSATTLAATTLTDRSVIRISGEDVPGFLQGLVTSDVAGPLPVWTGLLTPQGKCLFDFLLFGDGDDILVDCEEAACDELIKRLSLYRLRRPITMAREPALAVHWSVDGQGRADPRLAALGERWIAAPTEAASAWTEHRLRLGVCEGRAELGDLLWLECNAAELNGVSFTKGCFVGQENTARMNWRSTVNRRLFVVPIADAPEGKTRASYPDLALAVVHVRTADRPASAIMPEWMSLEPAK